METPSGSRPFSRITSDESDCPKEARKIKYSPLQSDKVSINKLVQSRLALRVNSLFAGSKDTSVDTENIHITLQKMIYERMWSSHTYVVGIDNEFDDIAGVGRQSADSGFRNKIF